MTYSVLTGLLAIKAVRHHPHLAENGGTGGPGTMIGDIEPALEAVDLKGVDKAALANIDPSPTARLIMSSYSLKAKLSLH